MGSHIRTGVRLFEAAEAYPMVVGVVALLLGLGLTYLYFCVIYPAKVAIYGPAGQSAPAAIVDMHTESDRNSVLYYADVQFQDAAGQTHLVHGTYGFMKYLALKDERNAVVRYLKRNPSMAFEIHSQQGDKPSVIWYGLQCGALLLVGVMGILYGRARDRTIEESDPQPRHAPPPRRPPGRPLA